MESPAKVTEQIYLFQTSTAPYNVEQPTMGFVHAIALIGYIFTLLCNLNPVGFVSILYLDMKEVNMEFQVVVIITRNLHNVMSAALFGMGHQLIL